MCEVRSIPSRHSPPTLPTRLPAIRITRVGIEENALQSVPSTSCPDTTAKELPTLASVRGIPWSGGMEGRWNDSEAEGPVTFITAITSITLNQGRRLRTARIGAASAELIPGTIS